MNLPIEAARKAAGTATRNILDLAGRAHAAGCLQKIDLVSTVGVGGVWHGPLPERWINEPRSFHNTYEQAKAEAEETVEREIAAGLPATVHRPSMVVGDSRTGRIRHFQIFYHLVEFLSGGRTFGFLPPLNDRHVDLIPVDCLAEAIAWSSRSPDTAGAILHLCAGPDKAVTLKALKERVRSRMAQRGIRLPGLRTVPAAWLAGAARLAVPMLPARLGRAVATLPVFLGYLAEDQSFSNDRTSALLARAGIAVPAPSEYLHQVIDYYLDHAYPRRP
jgi:nucleoside-diphosphate-sugar epimerase